MKEVVAGIDIGGTNTVLGLVERTGNIIAEAAAKNDPGALEAMQPFLELPHLHGMN